MRALAGHYEAEVVWKLRRMDFPLYSRPLVESIFPKGPPTGAGRAAQQGLSSILFSIGDKQHATHATHNTHHWGAALSPWLGGLRISDGFHLSRPKRVRDSNAKNARFWKRALHSNFVENGTLYQFANLQSMLKPALNCVVFSVEIIS